MYIYVKILLKIKIVPPAIIIYKEVRMGCLSSGTTPNDVGCTVPKEILKKKKNYFLIAQCGQVNDGRHSFEGRSRLGLADVIINTNNR